MVREPKSALFLTCILSRRLVPGPLETFNLHIPVFLRTTSFMSHNSSRDHTKAVVLENTISLTFLTITDAKRNYIGAPSALHTSPLIFPSKPLLSVIIPLRPVINKPPLSIGIITGVPIFRALKGRGCINQRSTLAGASLIVVLGTSVHMLQPSSLRQRAFQLLRAKTRGYLIWVPVV